MRYRTFLIPAIGILVVIFGFLIFGALGDNLVYFRTPTELVTGDEEAGRTRLGGQVEPGTVSQGETSVTFEVGDGVSVVPVVHQGSPAQLFREGIGVVVEGRWDGRIFHSDTMLIKHDEQYRAEDGSIYKPGSGLEP